MHRFRSAFLTFGCIIVFLAGIAGLQTLNFSWQKETFQTLEDNPLFIPNGQKMKNFTFGFENLITDLIWLKTVQYVGGNARGGYALLYDYLNNITEIDPYFFQPYWLGQLLLPEIDQSENAVKLSLKGLKNLPERWEIPFYLGFIYYYYLEEYDLGAGMYARAAKLPGTLGSAERMAANLKSKAGKHSVALAMWLELYQNSKNQAEKDLLGKKIISEKNFLDLEKAVQAYYVKKGTYPPDVKFLQQTGFIAAIPQDPIAPWKKYKIEEGKITLVAPEEK